MHTKPKTMSDMPMVSSHLRMLRPPLPLRALSTTAARRPRRVGTGVAPAPGSGDSTGPPAKKSELEAEPFTGVTSPTSGDDDLPKSFISGVLQSQRGRRH